MQWQPALAVATKKLLLQMKLQLKHLLLMPLLLAHLLLMPLLLVHQLLTLLRHLLLPAH
ncbi:MAG: hypothetical protein HC843_13185, partial [Sphingomonadales bacterium]|nr:hypothetical protein [Sphingomonadales bacterium]